MAVDRFGVPVQKEENHLYKKDYEIEELLSMKNYHNMFDDRDEC